MMEKFKAQTLVLSGFALLGIPMGAAVFVLSGSKTAAFIVAGVFIGVSAFIWCSYLWVVGGFSGMRESDARKIRIATLERQLEAITREEVARVDARILDLQNGEQSTVELLTSK